ncbi:MAG: hypothetical protein PHU25_01245 [Deltaproteobacteria bacterium]|nr:hypothetical protein [Deltaproteobacteria bacterium]
MTNTEKTPSHGFGTQLVIIGAGAAVIIVVVKILLFLRNLLYSALHFIGSVLSFLWTAALATGSAVVTALLVALLGDALAPIFRAGRWRGEVRRSIASCALPTIRTFRGSDSTSEVDMWLAHVVLRGKYVELFGEEPGANAFARGEADFAEFVANELPRALRGPFKFTVESQIFTPIFETYRAGDERTVKWVNDTIISKRVRHPVRALGRVIGTITLKRFGFGANEGYLPETVERRCADRRFIFDQVLWPHFWANARLVESWVPFDLAVEREPAPLPGSSREEQVVERVPVDELRYLLPPHIEDYELQDREPEDDPPDYDLDIDDDSPDLAAIRAEAESAVQAVMERCNTDGPWWESDRAAKTLAECDAVFLAALPYFHDAQFIYEQLARNEMRKHRLAGFTVTFEAAMREEGAEDPFILPWLAAAVMELDGDINLKRFRRLALRNYLNHLEPPSSAVAPVPSATPESPPPPPAAPATVHAGDEQPKPETARPRLRRVPSCF